MNKEDISTVFSKKILFVAILTAIFISVAMPLTYFSLSLNFEKERAVVYGEGIAWKIQEMIIENPDYWKYDITRFTQISYDAVKEESINEIKVYDIDKATILHDEEISHTHIFEITGEVKIMYNNRCFGYVVVSKSSKFILTATGILWIVFSVLALVIGNFIYRFPVMIVKESERKIHEILRELRESNNKLHKINANLQNEVIKDGKTGLYNASYMFQRLEDEMKRVDCYGGWVSVIMIDIDHFKKYNDYHGHVKGDEVLIQLSRLLEKSIRSYDVAGRYGGEEFIVIIVDASKEIA